MKKNEKNIFEEVIEALQVSHPDREIKWCYDTCIEVDGELEFDTECNTFVECLGRIAAILKA